MDGSEPSGWRDCALLGAHLGAAALVDRKWLETVYRALTSGYLARNQAPAA